MLLREPACQPDVVSLQALRLKQSLLIQVQAHTRSSATSRHVARLQLQHDKHLDFHNFLIAKLPLNMNHYV
jgi:hypothetical protein